MAWAAVEKVSTGVAQLFVSLVVTALLMPEDYGLVSILVVFTAVCSVIVDSGFSSALIRKTSITDEECNSVFAFNIGTAVVLYGALMLFLPTISDWFPNDSENIRKVAPILFLFIPINAAANIQVTILNRRLDFRRITRINIVSWFSAAGVAVAMALAGFGVWALVGQRVTQPLVRAVVLWTGGYWHPKGRLTLKPLRTMIGYGSRLLVSDLANTIFANISQLFIGRMYTTTELGYYDQGRRFKELPVTAVTSSMQSVTFPALAKIKADRTAMAQSSRKVIMMMNFLIFPLMTGLIVVAPDVYRCLLKSEWSAAVPFFQIFCVAGLFAPSSVVSYNILKVYSSGRTILITEIVKKAVATAVLILTIPISPLAVAAGQTAIFLTDAVANRLSAGRYVRFDWGETARSILPYAAMSLTMGAVVVGADYLLSDVVSRWVMLVTKIVLGVGTYVALTLIFRPAAWREALSILRSRRNR